MSLEMEGESRFCVEFPEGVPLLLVAKHRLTTEQVERIRDFFARARGEKSPVVIDAAIDVYQCVDGKWGRLGG